MVDPAGKVKASAVDMREAIAPLRSIDIGDDDFSDLEVLAELVGEADFVLLGEPHHGAGTSVAARARIVRFLRERLGFNLIVFEAPFFTCHQAWTGVTREGGSVELLQDAVFRMWSKSAQGRPLFDYIYSQAQGQRPLELAGMDPQLITSARYGPRAVFKRTFEEFLSREGCEPPWTPERLETLQLTVNLDEPPGTELAGMQGDLLAALEATASCADASEGTMPPPDAAFWNQVLWNLKQLARFALRDRASPELTGIRELTMLDNLDWIGRRRPGVRTIVWAANMHLAKDVRSVTERGEYANPGETPLGALLASKYGSAEVFSLMTSSDEYSERDGKVYRVERTEPSPSLERELHEKGTGPSIVDLDAVARLRGPSFVSSAFGSYERTARWNEVADALLYLPRIEPGLYPKN
jgi:erythromycin esterase